MARIRSIKPEFWSSEQVMNVSREARLLFIGLWNFADDSGRCVNSAKTLKAQVFPGDDDVDSTTIRRWLDDLSANDLLRQYEVDGKAYLWITGWNHQKIDRPRPSKYPDPPIGQNSTNNRRALATDLILPDPSGSDLRGSLAALPTGALASQKEGQPRKGPCNVSRTEFEEAFAKKRVAQ